MAAAADGWDPKHLPNIGTAGEGGDGEEEAPAPPLWAGNTMGKHRLSAAIDRLHQEIESLQGELEELDTLVPSSSTLCKEVFLGVESIPDGLIPTTKGPDNVAWDRWFQPVRGSHRRSRSSSSHRWWSRGKISEFS